MDLGLLSRMTLNGSQMTLNGSQMTLKDLFCHFQKKSSKVRHSPP